MGRSPSRNLFLVNVTILAMVLAFAVYQVPQPWRGILVGWLLFLVSIGWFVLHVLKHHYQYKALQLSARRSAPQRDRPPRRRPRHANREDLKVVLAQHSGRGRRVIR